MILVASRGDVHDDRPCSLRIWLGGLRAKSAGPRSGRRLWRDWSAGLSSGIASTGISGGCAIGGCQVPTIAINVTGPRLRVSPLSVAAVDVHVDGQRVLRMDLHGRRRRQISLSPGRHHIRVASLGFRHEILLDQTLWCPEDSNLRIEVRAGAFSLLRRRWMAGVARLSEGPQSSGL